MRFRSIYLNKSTLVNFYSRNWVNMTTTKWPITKLIEERINRLTIQYDRYMDLWEQLMARTPFDKACILDDILPKIAELENEQNKWISVEDRLPEDFSTVWGAWWVYWKLTWKIYHVRDWRFKDDKDIEHVTHWMPLPIPPTTNK